MYERNVYIMIYLDNSATSFVKPKEVQHAVQLAMTKYSGNPGRGGHRQSLITAVQIENVREKVANHVNISRPERVIFTQNCSDALNLAIQGTAKQGGHVICTENEHNSVLRPLQNLKNSGKIDYSVVFQSEDKGILVEDIEKQLRPNTYMVICNHISNVNGAKADIENVGKLCKSKNILFLVDGAQSGGHETIDMKKMGIDLLALAPHKGFYSLQGLGCLVINENVNLDPIRFGGTGTNSLELNQPDILPEKYEVGTIATPNILAFGAGIDFIENNFNSIKERLDDLTTYLHYELSKLPVIIYTHPENSNGVFAFNLPNKDSIEVTEYLDQHWGICTRGGYHCAPKKHEALGTLDTGCVRVSISYFNTFSEIQRLIIAIKHLLKKC